MLNLVKDLLELNQDTSAVLGVQEDNRVAVGTDLGLGVDGSDTAGLNLGQSVFNVVDLQADVVHTSTGVLDQEVSDGALLSEGLQQFNVGVTEEDENGGNSVVGQLLYQARI